jgi:NAD+ synthetase
VAALMKKFSLQNGKKRFAIIGLLIFFGFGTVFLRLIWLQVIQNEELARRAANQVTGKVTKYSPRGAILDCNGEELAVSIMSKSLYVDPVEMQDNPTKKGEKPERDVKRLAADLLAGVLQMKADELYSDFTTEARFIWLKRTMEPKEAAEVERIIRENKLPGLHFLEESKRYYTKKSMAAQVLGFVGTDDNGLSGIELALDSVVKGAETQQQEVVDALGRENVKALLMPSQFSSDHSVVDARELADNLGIAYDVVPITEAYKAVVDTMKPVIGGTAFDATEENIQARLRTVMLMALQNKCGYILLNSSNKSENALGFCTLYGDTAGAFSVTGDLYKGEIYDLARYINKLHDDVIPDSILTKEPSSELHPGQKDSDILPPYEVVDAILFRMIEEGQHREEIVNAGFDAEVVEKIHQMLMRNEKKRYQFPPVLRLSACAFGHERILPLTNKYGD